MFSSYRSFKRSPRKTKLVKPENLGQASRVSGLHRPTCLPAYLSFQIKVSRETKNILQRFF